MLVVARVLVVVQYPDMYFEDEFPRADSGLDRMSDAERSKVLRTAIDDVGLKCSEITRTFKQGVAASDGTEIWNAACSEGQNYVVTVRPGATSHVLDCIEYRRIAGYECFRRF